MTGGVANDKVFNTVELFFDGLLIKQKLSTGYVMKNRISRFVSVLKKPYPCCILKGVEAYDGKSNLASEKI